MFVKLLRVQANMGQLSLQESFYYTLPYSAILHHSTQIIYGLYIQSQVALLSSSLLKLLKTGIYVFKLSLNLLVCLMVQELMSFIRSYVVPEGFPDSVTPSYVPYMSWRALKVLN